jgi:flagellar biosynthetic protein FliP
MHTPSPYAVRRFVRHYLEMVVAMLAGMLVLGGSAGLALGALGVDLLEDAPQLFLLGMGVSMTVPMVAWMTWCGHGTRANAEMALSMVITTVAAMALLAAGAAA